MKPMLAKSLIHSRTLRLLTAGAAALLLTAVPRASACDGCNLAFQNEIVNERKDTAAGRDMIAAMENQKGLPISGMTSPVIAAAWEDAAPKASPLARAPASAARLPAGQAFGSSDERDFARIFGDDPFIEVIERDYSLPIPPTSYVPQTTKPDKSFTIRLDEGRTYLGNGVMYDGFLMNGSIPGPTIIVDEGDIVEFVVVNEGTVPHGASIHAAYTQTSKYLGNIAPGETKKMVFRATYPGVFMYHCAPGGHAIPMHVLFGQYGMMVVNPKKTQYKLEETLGQKPDVEIYLIQHEWYGSGKDAIEGRAMYTSFNGKLFRYIEDPIQAKPGDYVRINFLNIGPNQLSTFHMVGIIWDYVYWQGHPEAVMPGGQSVTAGPSDSWVIEFRVPPDEGVYLMLSHVVGATSRGAIGALVADRNAQTPLTVLADGPAYTAAELDELAAGSKRLISPFRPGSKDVDAPVIYGPETKEVTIQIIGNSYYPKVVQVAPGTKITWVNEDVFSFLAGEFSGIHNAVVTQGPERFASPLLAHAESFSFTVTQRGEYDYICTPHPYMKGRIIVGPPVTQAGAAASTPWYLAAIGALALLLVAAGYLWRRKV